VRFLVDEMFGPDAAERLNLAGHDAVHVNDVGLGGAPDRDVLAYASEDDRIVVTENAADFVPLLDARIATGLPTSPVVIALKRNLPAGAGAMNNALAEKLTLWAKDHPSPYRHAHWVS
jgi:predicted nuclease of predicted toxin-antitoxin system